MPDSHWKVITSSVAPNVKRARRPRPRPHTHTQTDRHKHTNGHKFFFPSIQNLLLSRILMIINEIGWGYKKKTEKKTARQNKTNKQANKQILEHHRSSSNGEDEIWAKDAGKFITKDCPSFHFKHQSLQLNDNNTKQTRKQNADILPMRTVL